MVTDRRAPVRSRYALVALLAALLTVLAACSTGGDGGEDPSPPDGSQDPEPADPGEVEPEPAEPAPTEPPAPDPEVAPDLSVPLDLEEVAVLGAPTAGAVGPDGILYLAERSGTVHPLGPGGIGPAVVDVSSETTTQSERGLLGLAFAADGSELYLSLTDRDGDTLLLAMAVEDGQILSDSSRTLLRVPQPYPNHNGGDLHIGPDGLLYLGLGDGGSAGDPLDAGQDLSTPLGALLRLDPGREDGIPPDNPFVDVDGAAPEVYLYGLRNPWRFSFDPATDELWIADVGQDAREEINRLAPDQAAGANLGWNQLEGSLPYAGSEPDDHVLPVYEYDTRGPEGCAVTGGVVYRGQAIPELQGVYLYADFCNGEVRGLVPDAAGGVSEQASLGIDGGQVVAFVVDPDGEVLVLDLGGRVLRIVPA